MITSQPTHAVLMVRPSSFGFNQQTAGTNHFQNHVELSGTTIQQRADAEFMTMVDSLRHYGIEAIIFTDSKNTPPKPDAVFPNNWLSMWPDGTVYLYPMAAENRRLERSPAVLELLRQQFTITTISDISQTEHYGVYLESTGAIVFDHANKIAYGCISERCDRSLFVSHALQLGYTPVPFHAYDPSGSAIYHTNVMMGIARDSTVICAEAITDLKERAQVLTALEQSGRVVVSITQGQMAAFCGNVLELRNTSGKRFLAMSQTAFDAFTPEQRQTLSKDKTLLPFKIPTIETIGGGSVRCMMAEIFLPRNPALAR